MTAGKKIGFLQRLKQKSSISRVYTVVITLSILAVSSVVGYLSINLLYSSKIRDSFGMMFLDLERQGLNMRAAIMEKALTYREAQRSPTYQIEVSSNGSIKIERGPKAKLSKLQDIGLTQDDLAQKSLITNIAGAHYLVLVNSERKSSALTRLKLYKIPLDDLVYQTSASSTEATVYITTRTGLLVYSNKAEVSSGNVNTRPIVKAFIDSPLSQGQFALPDSKLTDAAAFYHQINGTNLVIFTEVSKSPIYRSIMEMIGRYVVLLVLIIALTIAFIQLPLSYLSEPVRGLIHNAVEIAKGNYNIKIEEKSFGEIAILERVYGLMIENLRTRDTAIQNLLHVQNQKIRMQGELSMARGIQENLLPRLDHPRTSGIEVAVKYEPAAEVSGDWYHYHYNERTGESVIVICDVSGHGAGASMFTAIIAGVFRDHTYHNDRFAVDGFLKSINKLVMEYGALKNHASVQIVVFDKESTKAEIINAGHPPPVLISERQNLREVKQIRLQSSVIGLSPKLNIARTSLKLEKGDTLLLYTDGLYESVNQQGRAYSRKRIVKFTSSGVDRPVKDWVMGLHSDWENFRGGISPNDDLCIVGLRAVA